MIRSRRQSFRKSAARAVPEAAMALGQALLTELEKNAPSSAVCLALVASGAAVNQQSRYSRETPLTWAVRRQMPDVVQALVNKGADVNLGNWNNTTPLMLAVQAGSLHIVKILLDADADPAVKSNIGDTAMISAQRGAFKDVVDALNLFSIRKTEEQRRDRLKNADRMVQAGMRRKRRVPIIPPFKKKPFRPGGAA